MNDISALLLYVNSTISHEEMDDRRSVLRITRGPEIILL